MKTRYRTRHGWKTPPETTYIYALLDPNGDVRYVGKADDPKSRMRQHWNMCDKTYEASGRRSKKKLWISELKKRGVRPSMIILERCQQANAVERERFWINYYLDAGADLTNTAKV